MNYILSFTIGYFFGSLGGVVASLWTVSSYRKSLGKGRLKLLK
jgi:hypothetical protein